MAIVKMKRLRLVALRSDREALLRDFQISGLVQTVLFEEEASGEVSALTPKTAEYGAKLVELRNLCERVAHAVAVLDKYANVKAPMFAPRREISSDAFYSAEEGALEKLEVIEKSERALLGSFAESAKLEADVLALEPWRNLPIDLAASDTETVNICFGAISQGADVDAINNALNEIHGECALYPAASDLNRQCLLVVYHRDFEVPVLDVLRGAAFSRIYFPGIKGSANDNIERLSAELAENRAKSAEFLAELAKLGSFRDAMRLWFDKIERDIELEETRLRIVETDRAIVLSGWVREPDVAALASILANYQTAFEFAEPEPGDDVPVELNNNKFTEPLSMVTNMYSLPAYGNIDPNPLILPFFCVFFGLMLNDIGYGLLLIAASVFVRLKSKGDLRGGMKYATGLLLLCGVTTAVSGVLSGSFFSNAVPVISKMLTGTEVNLPWNTLFDPLADPMTVLIASLVLGAIQIVTGMAIRAYILIRDAKRSGKLSRGIIDAVCDVGSWYVLFAGLGLLAAGIPWVALAGALMLVCTQGRASKSIPGKIFGGLGSLYDITSYVSDILSYSRIMALMLSGGVIGMVFNTLGAIPNNIFVFIPIFLIGHSFNLGLNIIGTFVHAARLQYLEYFGKFYEDGGKPFKPLSLANTKYFRVRQKEA
ncbi:MAG: V-type ATP synthase subunit I [Oscillospiraceae bacterium]|jgi:V/A-type H+-transporting ATPase subunit I|nr:V-type ATP synthase subunit I [Oscillospiraceae bacterium]